jgi:hypothetical protein
MMRLAGVNTVRWTFGIKDKETETVVPAMDWSSIYTTAGY